MTEEEIMTDEEIKAGKEAIKYLRELPLEDYINLACEHPDYDSGMIFDYQIMINKALLLAEEVEELEQSNSKIKKLLEQYRLIVYSKFGKTFGVGDNIDDYISKQKFKQKIKGKLKKIEDKDKVINKIIEFYIKERDIALEEVKWWEKNIQNSIGKKELESSRKSWIRGKTIALTKYECFRNFINILEENKQ